MARYFSSLNGPCSCSWAAVSWDLAEADPSTPERPEIITSHLPALKTPESIRAMSAPLLRTLGIVFSPARLSGYRPGPGKQRQCYCLRESGATTQIWQDATGRD